MSLAKDIGLLRLDNGSDDLDPLALLELMTSAN